MPTEKKEPAKPAKPVGKATAKESVPKAKATPKAGPKAQRAKIESNQPAGTAKAAQPKVVTKQAKVKLSAAERRHGRRYREAAKLIDAAKRYDLPEALELVKKTSTVKFDAGVELHINLGLDPKQADQAVRATVLLPAGTGKTVKVAALVPAGREAEAKQAGADLIGEEAILAQLAKEQINFDVLITTPDMMPKLSKLAKLLGPKGLMPNPKSGTVTNEVGRAVAEAKAGRVEFRIDKQAIIHQVVGKTSFQAAALEDNAKALVAAVMKAKPASAKGTYLQNLTLTSTMGPGIRLDPASVLTSIQSERK